MKMKLKAIKTTDNSVVIELVTDQDRVISQIGIFAEIDWKTNACDGKPYPSGVKLFHTEKQWEREYENEKDD
jgi:hypothetical protein